MSSVRGLRNHRSAMKSDSFSAGHEEFPLAVGRKGEASINVLPGKFRKIL